MALNAQSGEVMITASMTVCNKCGKQFNLWDEKEDFSIRKRLGYGTKYDGDTLELDLCCDCMESLIDSCTINPIITNT